MSAIVTAVSHILALVAALLTGYFVLSWIAVWASTKPRAVRNIVSFSLACVSSYAAEFLLYMWLLGAMGKITPVASVIAPSMTWFFIAAMSFSGAYVAAGSAYAIALPFVLAGATMAILVRTESHIAFVVAPLILIGTAIPFVVRKFRDLQPPQANEIRRTAVLAAVFKPIGFANVGGAVVCSFWLIYLAYAAHGIALAVALLFFFTIAIFPFGTAPLFVLAASILSFYIHAVGAWLPVTSYVTAAIALYVDLRTYRLRRAGGDR